MYLNIILGDVKMKYVLLGIYMVYVLSTITSIITNNITFNENFTGDVLSIYRKDSLNRSIVGIISYTLLLYLLQNIILSNIIINIFIYALVYLVDNLIVNNVFDKIMILRLQPIVDEIKKQEALKQRKAEYLFGDEKDKD